MAPMACMDSELCVGVVSLFPLLDKTVSEFSLSLLKGYSLVVWRRSLRLLCGVVSTSGR